MLSASQCRLLGYSATLALHGWTIVDVFNRIGVTTVEDQEVADFVLLKYRFLTVWTFLLQIAYLALGLSCEVLGQVAGDFTVTRLLARGRELLFTSIVWPSCVAVPLFFWPLYLYDIELVFPSFIDKILSSANNQVMHTAILVFALWELVLLPRSRPRTHTWRLLALYTIGLIYSLVLVLSYFERGCWLYPIFNKIHGTIYIYIYFFIMVPIVALFGYSIQWPLTRLVWGNRQKVE